VEVASPKPIPKLISRLYFLLCMISLSYLERFDNHATTVKTRVSLFCHLCFGYFLASTVVYLIIYETVLINVRLEYRNLPFFFISYRRNMACIRTRTTSPSHEPIIFSLSELPSNTEILRLVIMRVVMCS